MSGGGWWPGDEKISWAILDFLMIALRMVSELWGKEGEGCGWFFFFIRVLGFVRVNKSPLS